MSWRFYGTLVSLNTSLSCVRALSENQGKVVDTGEITNEKTVGNKGPELNYALMLEVAGFVRYSIGSRHSQ